MGALWQKVETPHPGASRAGKDAVGGAVVCLVENRAYLVGGSGPTTNDPDIALGCLCWSWSSPVGPEGQHGKTAGRQVASPTLTRITASQEGDVPSARIGHAAVVLSSSPLAPTPSPTSSSIFVFGGEASCPSAAACSGGDESAPAEHPTLADVYEASPKGTSGILVWRALTPAGVRCPGGLKDTTESDPVRDTPAPVAFPASCAASVRGSCEAENGGGNSDGIEEALLVHGGRDQRSELLADLWAFFPSRLSKCLLQVGGEGGQEGNEDGCGTATGWQRLNPQGEGPPPAAYHSATPVCEGRTVVFIGGGKSWAPSSIFLLDAVELIWSVFEVTGGVGLSEQRCLHTAVSVTGVGLDGDGDVDAQRQEGDAMPPPSSDTAALEGTAPPPSQSGSKDATAATAVADDTAAPAVQLWGPVAPRGGAAAPASATSAGSEKTAAAGASAAKKKAGAKEDTSTVAKKTVRGSKEAVHAGSGGKPVSDGSGENGVDGDEADGDIPPPMFERILIFGGIVDEAAVSGDAIVLRQDGTTAPLQLGQRSCPAPAPRFSHTMVPVPMPMPTDSDSGDANGSSTQSALLFGGCHGDGTRVAEDEAFVLDLSGGGGGLAAGGRGRGDADETAGENGLDGGDAQAGNNTIVLENGDVYTGARDEDGRRQGKGRCDYGAAMNTSTGGGGGGGGYYVGDWDADEPHGQGERTYPPPPGGGARVAGGRDGGGGGHGQGEATGDQDEDMAIVLTAFGPGCPPLASYRGEFRRGVREGNGVCSFVASANSVYGAAVGGGPMPLSGGFSAGAGGGSCALLVPASYDGEWVGGRPLGRGVLTLRAAPATAATAAAVPGKSYPSSGSTAPPRGGMAGRKGSCAGSSIEGVWTEEGLVHGRERLSGRGGVYEGQYRLGRREGHGRLVLPDGSEYEGAWKNGRQNGIGTYRCGISRHVYTGKWVGGVRCGRGVCEYASGSRYEGLWLDGLRHGEGVLSAPPGGGDSLAGLWHRDEFNLVSASGSFRLSTENGSTPKVFSQ